MHPCHRNEDLTITYNLLPLFVTCCYNVYTPIFIVYLPKLKKLFEEWELIDTDKSSFPPLNLNILDIFICDLECWFNDSRLDGATFAIFCCIRDTRSSMDLFRDWGAFLRNNGIFCATFVKALAAVNVVVLTRD